MVGEKNLNPDHYTDGVGAIDDDDGLFVGFDDDTGRITNQGPKQDTPGLQWTYFGSAHPGGFNMAMCDGSVHTISYDIDDVTHQRFGNRADGEVVDSEGL